MKTKAKLIALTTLTCLNLLHLNYAFAYTAAGGVGGGGGDFFVEPRIDEIRADILKWIVDGDSKDLVLPKGLKHDTYVDKMRFFLARHAVIISSVTTEQARSTQDKELMVMVDGVEKTCRGFFSKKDGYPHILCNIERFKAASEQEQYRLIHHEYAGLAGVEKNVGSSSDYRISNQITSFLKETTVLKLAVKRSAYAPNFWSLKTNVDGVELIIDANNPAASGAIVDSRGWEAVTSRNPRTGITCKVRFNGVTDTGGSAEIEEINGAGETKQAVHFEGTFYSSTGGCTFARSDKLHF